MSQTIVQPNIFPILRYRDATGGHGVAGQSLRFRDANGDAGPGRHGRSRASCGWAPGTIGVSSKTPPDGKNPWTTVDQGVYVCVDNPDAHHDRAKAAGATIETPLRDLDYGSRSISARDPGGHLWAFGTYRMTDAVDAPNMYPDALGTTMRRVRWRGSNGDSASRRWWSFRGRTAPSNTQSFGWGREWSC